MKMYKVSDIVEVLTEYQQIGINGYCGFEFEYGTGNLVITLKDNAPDVPEAVEEVTIVTHVGEY